MTDTEQSLITISQGVAILSILSWACGERSFLGHKLALRMEPAWVGCRCFGIGIFISLITLRAFDDSAALPLWLVCALSLGIGCARKKVAHINVKEQVLPEFNSAKKSSPP